MITSVPPLDPFLFLPHGPNLGSRAPEAAPFMGDEVFTLASSTPSHPTPPH